MQLVSIRGWIIFAAFGLFAISRFVVRVRLQRYIHGSTRSINEEDILSEQGRRLYRWDRWFDRVELPVWIIAGMLMLFFSKK